MIFSCGSDWTLRSFAENFVERVAECDDAFRVLLGDVLQLGVCKNHRPYVRRLRHCGEHLFHDGEMILTRVDRLDALRRLPRIGGIGDHDPVAMTEQRKLLFELKRARRLGRKEVARPLREKQRDEGGGVFSF